MSETTGTETGKNKGKAGEKVRRRLLDDFNPHTLSHLPTPPEVIAQEIVEDLQAALSEFAAIAEALFH